MKSAANITVHIDIETICCLTQLHDLTTVAQEYFIRKSTAGKAMFSGNDKTGMFYAV